MEEVVAAAMVAVANTPGGAQPRQLLHNALVVCSIRTLLSACIVLTWQGMPTAMMAMEGATVKGIEG
jgi:hypothetical protein